MEASASRVLRQRLQNLGKQRCLVRGKELANLPVPTARCFRKREPLSSVTCRRDLQAVSSGLQGVRYLHRWSGLH